MNVKISALWTPSNLTLHTASMANLPDFSSNVDPLLTLTCYISITQKLFLIGLKKIPQNAQHLFVGSESGSCFEMTSLFEKMCLKCFSIWCLSRIHEMNSTVESDKIIIT